MKLVFATDLHIRSGFPFAARAWVEANKIARGLDGIIIVPGDVYDNAALAMGKDSTAGEMVSAFVAPVVEHGNTVYAVPGNHDIGPPGKPSAISVAAGVPNFHVHERPELVRIERRGESVLVALVPWAWKSHMLALPQYRDLPPAELDDVAGQLRQTIIRSFAARWNGDRAFKVLALHAEIDGSKKLVDGSVAGRYQDLPEGEAFRFSVAQLREAGADAIAAGHVHLKQAIDGQEIYIGALVEQNHGEAGYPTGVMVLDTTNGTREYIAIDSRHHFTVDTAGYRRLVDEQIFRPGTDVVKIRDKQDPFAGATPPAGVTFEAQIAPKETRTRAKNVTSEASTHELFGEWYDEQPREIPREDLLPYLDRAIAAAPPRAQQDATGGCIDAVREITLKNIAAHTDTHIAITPQMDGLIGFMGRKGSGKSTALEGGIVATLWGEWVFYDIPGVELADMIPPRATGQALHRCVVESRGKTYRAERRFKISGTGTKKQECYLYEVRPGQTDLPLAGPKQDDYLAKVTELFGTRDLFLATAFQGQKEVGSVIDKKPRERMEFMRKLVNADRFGATFEWTKKQASDAEKRADDAEKQAARITPSQDESFAVDTGLEMATLNHARHEHDFATYAAQQKDAEETLSRLRADELQREELQRHLDAATARVNDLSRERDRLLIQVDDARAQLDMEPTLRAEVDRLAALREERAEAQREAESLATVQAQRQAKQAEINGLTAEISADHRAACGEKERERAALRDQWQGVARQIEAAVAEARAEVERKRSELRLQAQDLAAQIECAVREATAQREAEVRRIEKAMDAAWAELQRNEASYRSALEVNRKTLEIHEKQAARLGEHGYISECRCCEDARAAVVVVEETRQKIAGIERILSEQDFGHTFRDDIAHLQVELDALKPVVAEEIAADLRATLVTAQAEAAAIADVDPNTVATDLRAQATALVAHGQAIKDPTQEEVCAEKLQRLAGLRADLEAILTPMSFGRDVATISADIAKIADAEQRLGRLTAVREQLAEKEAALAEKSQALEAAATAHTQAKERLAAAGDISGQIATARTKIEEIHRSTETLRAALLEDAKQIGALEEAKRQLEERARKAGELREQASRLRTETQAFGLLAEFFGPTGAPQLLIDLACPALNAILADIVRQLGERETITCSTLRDLKGGGTRDGFYITVEDALSERDIALHSGGEQSWQRGAVRMAFGLFAAQRTDNRHGIYACDEPTAHLDPESIRKMLGIIYGLTNKFRQVFIIDHNTEFLSGISTAFHFEKVNDRTVVTRPEYAALPAQEPAMVA